MSKKLGFALGAGGSRGVSHIGFLKAMDEEGIVPDFIAGSSMGSVVGSCYAAGMKPDDMFNEVMKLKFNEIFGLTLNPLGQGALSRTTRMKKKLKSFLGDKTFNDLKIPFSAIVTDLNTGNPLAISGDKNVVDYVAASSTIPMIFEPFNIGDMSLVDGGVTTRVPVKEVRKMGAEVIVAVDVLGKVRPQHKKHHMFSMLFRAYDIMDSQLSKYKMKQYKPDIMVFPDLGDMNQLKFKGMDMAFEKGYEIGKEVAPKIKELIKD
ncbi:MAG: patatin-like phospholipase family protein [Clostridiales bacterium]|nr:patatin-like phospholipase family protein [Clostridiales bacterium]